MNNYERITQHMSVDELAQWMARSSIFYETQMKTFEESIAKDWTPVQATLNNIYEYKQWLLAESEG